ncbi:hypothetical protein [Nocardia sp. CA-119907]|uniref:hypothetical protein n=1 Tax=Nocardia sp. CA-119907 TaxID=3239973 RepID=UPI003D96754F
MDRLTFGGNIIETGTDSYRLAHTKAALAAAANSRASEQHPDPASDKRARRSRR